MITIDKEQLEKYKRERARRARMANIRAATLDLYYQPTDCSDIIQFIRDHGYYDANEPYDYVPSPFGDFETYAEYLKRTRRGEHHGRFDIAAAQAAEEWYEQERKRRLAPMFQENIEQQRSRQRLAAFMRAKFFCAHCGSQWVEHEHAQRCANSHPVKTYEFAPELKPKGEIS
jgi:hypothetical protein